MVVCWNLRWRCSYRGPERYRVVGYDPHQNECTSCPLALPAAQRLDKPLISQLYIQRTAASSAKSSAAIFKASESAPFELKDSTGTILVDPDKPSHTKREWFFEEVHHEKIVTIDLDKLQIQSGETAANVKYRSDALNLFQKHAPSKWNNAGWDERYNQMSKGWCAYENAMTFGQRVAVIGCQYVDKDTFDISIVPLYMTTNPGICAALGEAGGNVQGQMR